MPADIRPSVINGSSAGWPPRRVKIKKAAKNCQVMPFRIGSLAQLTDQRPLLKQGTTTTNTAATRPITPPNLLGIARRTVYANRKYHSGTICGGVTRGSAGLKLSTSPSSHGAHITRNKRSLIAGIAPMISFQVKYGWK